MDQLALNALEPFVALAKSATSPRAASDLVTQATSATNTYVFAELLRQPNIQALKGDEQCGRFYHLLCIFSWGTWEQYKATPGLPELTDTQTLKLRLLSLLTIAAEHKSASSEVANLSYASLTTRLGLASTIDLEHLVTQAAYSNLLTATLNPASQTVLVQSVSALRDLAPGSIGTMIAELEAWSQRCASVMVDLDREIQKVKADAAKRAQREARTERQIKAVMEDKSKEGGVLGISRGGHNTRGARRDMADDDDYDDEMDVDGGKKKGGMGGFLGRFQGKGVGR